MNRRELLIAMALFTGTTLFGISEEFDDTTAIYNKDRIATSLLKKLTKVQDQVGCRKFNIISFDYEVLKPYTPNENFRAFRTTDMLQDIFRLTTNLQR